MKKINEVQPHAVQLIAAHPYLAGQTVLADLGLSDKDVEKALRDRGICVRVLPLDNGQRRDTGSRRSPISLSVLVVTEISPAVNAANAGKDIYLVMAAVEEALLGYVGINPNDAYQPGEEAFNFLDADPGLLVYIQTFQKLAVY